MWNTNYISFVWITMEMSNEIDTTHIFQIHLDNGAIVYAIFLYNSIHNNRIEEKNGWHCFWEIFPGSFFSSQLSFVSSDKKFANFRTNNDDPQTLLTTFFDHICIVYLIRCFRKQHFNANNHFCSKVQHVSSGYMLVMLKKTFGIFLTFGWQTKNGKIGFRKMGLQSSSNDCYPNSS